MSILANVATGVWTQATCAGWSFANRMVNCSSTQFRVDSTWEGVSINLVMLQSWLVHVNNVYSRFSIEAQMYPNPSQRLDFRESLMWRYGRLAKNGGG